MGSPEEAGGTSLEGGPMGVVERDSIVVGIGEQLAMESKGPLDAEFGEPEGVLREFKMVSITKARVDF